MEDKFCSKCKHLLVWYSKDDLPYKNCNLELVNYDEKWINGNGFIKMNESR